MSGKDPHVLLLMAKLVERRPRISVARSHGNACKRGVLSAWHCYDVHYSTVAQLGRQVHLTAQYILFAPKLLLLQATLQRYGSLVQVAAYRVYVTHGQLCAVCCVQQFSALLGLTYIFCSFPSAMCLCRWFV